MIDQDAAGVPWKAEKVAQIEGYTILGALVFAVPLLLVAFLWGPKIDSTFWRHVVQWVTLLFGSIAYVMLVDEIFDKLRVAHAGGNPFMDVELDPDRREKLLGHLAEFCRKEPDLGKQVRCEDTGFQVATAICLVSVIGGFFVLGWGWWMLGAITACYFLSWAIEAIVRNPHRNERIKTVRERLEEHMKTTDEDFNRDELHAAVLADPEKLDVGEEHPGLRYWIMLALGSSLEETEQIRQYYAKKKAGVDTAATEEGSESRQRLAQYRQRLAEAKQVARTDPVRGLKMLEELQAEFDKILTYDDVNNALDVIIKDMEAGFKAMENGRVATTRRHWKNSDGIMQKIKRYDGADINADLPEFRKLALTLVKNAGDLHSKLWEVLNEAEAGNIDRVRELMIESGYEAPTALVEGEDDETDAEGAFARAEALMNLVDSKQSRAEDLIKQGRLEEAQDLVMSSVEDITKAAESITAEAGSPSTSRGIDAGLDFSMKKPKLTASPDDMSLYWKCPKCGVVLEKKSDTMAILADTIEGGGIVSGSVTCASCGAAHATRDVYSGKFDVAKGDALKHLFVFRNGPRPDDPKWYVEQAVKGLFLKVDGNTKIHFETSDDTSQTYVLARAMNDGVSSGDLGNASIQTFNDKDGYKGVVLKI